MNADQQGDNEEQQVTPATAETEPLPVAARLPLRYRLRNWAYRAAAVSLCVAIGAEALACVTFFAVGGEVAAVFFALFLFAFVAYLLSLGVWLGVLATCFMRYSLRTLLLVILFGGACGTLIAATESDGWKVVGAAGLFLLACFIMFGIASFDPTPPAKPPASAGDHEHGSSS